MTQLNRREFEYYTTPGDFRLNPSISSTRVTSVHFLISEDTETVP